jgi:alkaline phosphatase D
MPRLIPVFATWDDHDFGSADGDRRFQFKDQARDIFQTFFPMEESKTLKKGPGVASALTLGKQTYVFFDDRSFRSQDRVTPGDTHFGKSQEDWFFKLLNKNKGPFWLIDGDQFFGGHQQFESYEGNHPLSFKNFLNRLKSAKRTVLFISGDRHLAEVMKIPKTYLGYTTYEFTSSGLHATMFPGSLAKAPNPRGIFGQDGESHFLLIKGTAISPRRLNLEAAYFGEQANVLYHQSLEVER